MTYLFNCDGDAIPQPQKTVILRVQSWDYIVKSAIFKVWVISATSMHERLYLALHWSIEYLYWQMHFATKQVVTRTQTLAYAHIVAGQWHWVQCVVPVRHKAKYRSRRQVFLIPISRYFQKNLLLSSQIRGDRVLCPQGFPSAIALGVGLPSHYSLDFNTRVMRGRHQKPQPMLAWFMSIVTIIHDNTGISIHLFSN